VVDALRWVLGEQNPRSLRGQRWEEVIFAGAATRRPLSLAEVVVTLHDSDEHLTLPWRELEITRRVVRSGESEYLINRTPCRLKDVLDVTAKIAAAGGAWGHIAQSGVDEILNSRPEERRKVIEEAAGLARFQSRREEIHRRLEEADVAARRIRDLSVELECQLEPLSAEAGVAERFLALRRELEDVEAAVWADAAARLGRRLDAAARRREEFRRTVAGLEDNVLAARGHVSVCRSRLDLAREKRDQTSERERQADAEAGESRQSLAVLDGKLAAGEAAVRAARERVSSLSSRASELRRAVTAARQPSEAEGSPPRRSGPDGGSLSKDIAAAQDRLAAAIEERRKRSAGRSVLAERLSAAENERSAVSEAVSGIEARMKDLENRAAALDSELSGAMARRASSETSMLEAEGRERAAAEAIRAAGVKLSGIQAAAERGSAASAALRETQARLAGEQAALEERLSSLETVAPETPLAAARAARKAAAASGLAADGPLADLLDVDPGYEKAAQAALGAALCGLTVADLDTAVRILGLAGASPAPPILSVIPREGRLVSGHGVQRGTSAALEGVDRLLAHVRTGPGAGDAPSREMLARLLDGWAVAADLGQASSLWSRNLAVRAVVTLGGEVITTEGVVVSGGASPAGQALVQRREQADLRRRLSEIRRGLADASADLDRLQQEGAALTGQERELRDELGSAERARAAASEEVRRFAEARAREAARRENLLAERARLQGEAAGLKDRLAVARMDGDARARACARLREQAGEADLLLRDAETRVEAEREKLHGLELSAARAAEEARARSDRLARLEEERDSVSRGLQEAKDGHVRARTELSELRAQRSAAKTKLRELERLQAGLRRAAAAAAVELRASEAALARAGSELDELTAQREKSLARLRRVEVLVERLQGETRTLEVARNALSDRYKDLVPALSPDPDSLVRRRSELSDLLASMGEVNLGAAEQCRRLRERVQYLASQEADVRSSKEALLVSAGELESEMTRRFKATFEACKERFSQVFTDLFSGGRADLVLTDPEGPLSSGVDIIAQPPGKRLAGLGLLSGGERALTAVALLLALAGGAVEGFLVLDEVDAYLDDPNCARFCRYLQRLACGRQFVVITHNKATMEAATTLYGLTLEEEGVSRVVSVRLDQAAAAAGGPA